MDFDAYLPLTHMCIHTYTYGYEASITYVL